MALVECNECHQEISSSARTCPHCGSKRTHPFVMVFAIFVVFVVVMMIIGAMSK